MTVRALVGSRWREYLGRFPLHHVHEPGTAVRAPERDSRAMAEKAASTPQGNAHSREDATFPEKTMVCLAHVTPTRAPHSGWERTPASLEGWGSKSASSRTGGVQEGEDRPTGSLPRSAGRGCTTDRPSPVPGAHGAWSPGPPQPVSLETAVGGWAGGPGNARLLNDARGSSSKKAGACVLRGGHDLGGDTPSSVFAANLATSPKQSE